MLGYKEEELLRLGLADIHQEESLPFVINQFELLAEKILYVVTDPAGR
jgi:hypothetical protein